MKTDDNDNDKPISPQRHRNMAAIHSTGTKPEMIVRKYLFARGYRYRLNHPRLPGHPDIVLQKCHTVTEVNGCFWHRHEGCKYAYTPKTRMEFWQQKFENFHQAVQKEFQPLPELTAKDFQFRSKQFRKIRFFLFQFF